MRSNEEGGRREECKRSMNSRYNMNNSDTNRDRKITSGLSRRRIRDSSRLSNRTRRMSIWSILYRGVYKYSGNE
jgi:hypothetical protein